jgi:cAMP-dependent protein kinase regulator
LVKARPENIVVFCIDWFKKHGTIWIYSGEIVKKHIQEVAELSDEENDVVDDVVFKAKKCSQVAKRNRSGVSAEVYGEFNKKESFTAKVHMWLNQIIPKSEDTKTRILILLRNSILFKNLDTVETEIVMGAMEEKEYQTGQNVIREGDGGDVLYMVE